MRTLSLKTIFPALLVMLGICMLAAGCTTDTTPTETTPYGTTAVATTVATTAPAAGTTVSGAA
ncbi:MAG: hypothetical protein M0P22_09125 [Methanoculleus sp.]|jgi:hypothetical protein|nr:hypothetical protein [Methanoculleus sp.]